MDKISIIIPAIGQHAVTQRCIECIQENSKIQPEIIIVDNGSKEPYTGSNVIRNDLNRGLVAALQQGLDHCTGDIILFMHNDVLIHEKDWDDKVRLAFSDTRVGLGGFFGARMVFPDGGRGYCESQMLGKEWGTDWTHHSRLQMGISPASVLDGLALLFRVSMLKELGIPECPPHHWYDRLLPLHYIWKGNCCVTIGVGFDHGSGFTSSGEDYHTFARQWCTEGGIEVPNGDYDSAIYNEGAKLFQALWAHKLPLTVDEHFGYRWTA